MASMRVSETIMRKAKSWLEVVHAAARLGAEGEFERQIRRIQADALIHAASTLRRRIPVLALDLESEATQLDPGVP